MKYKNIILCALFMLLIFSSCAKADDVSTISQTMTTRTVSEAAETAVSSTKESTTVQTTTNKTTKATETQGQTAAKATTSKSTTQTTTKKATTTKQTLTTSAPYWCTEGGSNHVVNVGTVGWYSSYTKAESAAKAYINAYANGRSGRYLVDECSCGLFTAIITFN